MSLEQQLSDAIAAQNALTQAVAQWKGQIDAATVALQQQATAAMETTRVYSSNGVVRARSIVQYHNTDEMTELNSGVFVVKTPIPMVGNTMVRFDINGYDYGEAKIIEHSIVTYAYSALAAPDSTPGFFVNTSVQRKGNTTKNGIWLAEDPATNNACLVFGTPQSLNYNVSFVIDATFYAGVPSTNPADWSVSTNNSVAPAPGATTGFGLINLLTL